MACEVGKGSEKRGKCEIRLPFSACEAGKGSEKRGKCEIRLLVSPTPRKEEKQVIAEVSLQLEEKGSTEEEGKASHSRGESPARREG